MRVGRGALGALGGVVITGGGSLAYQLFLHYGRLLVRLEEMERRGGHPSLAPVAGLPLGTVVHDLELAGDDGGHVTLSHGRRRVVLLVFVDVRCGFSRELVRELDALPSHSDGVVAQLLILTAEDSEDTRRLLEESPPRWPVLLQEASEVAVLSTCCRSAPSRFVFQRSERARRTFVDGSAPLIRSRIGGPPAQPRVGQRSDDRP